MLILLFLQIQDLKSIMKIAAIICDFAISVFLPNKFYCNLIFLLQLSFLLTIVRHYNNMSGMEADDLDDSLCGGAKCDRENSDCAQFESRNKDKTKVTNNVMSYYFFKSDSIIKCTTFLFGLNMWKFEFPGLSFFSYW